MSDSTPRLKIPELVSMQEANAATWNEALVQLDALVDLYLLGQYVNTPPGSPADGDAYLIGASPTGAWSGYAYKIASCIDGAWRFYTPFNGLKAYVATTGAFIVYAGGTWTNLNTNLSAAETNIASAATCDLGGALFVQITGTTTITSFGTGANKLCFVRFAQALTLTHNATSLILLGGASRTTAANDVGIYTSDGSGNWRERDYRRAASDAGDLATKSGTETLSNKTLGATNFPGNDKFDSSGNLVLNSTNAAAAKLDVYGKVVCGLASARGYGDSLCATNGAASQTSVFLIQSGVGSGYFGLKASDSALYLINSYASGTMADTAGFALDTTGNFTPLTDNGQNLGSASKRMKVIYAGTGTINTSGAGTKTNVRPLSEAEIAVARTLAGNVRIFQFVDAVATKGVDAARLHGGMIFEDVVAAFAAQGLDPMRYGLVCRDGDPENWILGLRYEELAQFVLAGLNARIAALEAK